MYVYALLLQHVPHEMLPTSLYKRFFFSFIALANHRHLSPTPSVGAERRRHRTSSMSQMASSTSTRNTALEPLIRTPNRTIYTAGRPPWYDSQGQQAEPCFIGICGGSASGKTTVAKAIIEALHVPWVTLLSMDSFYKVIAFALLPLALLDYGLRSRSRTWAIVIVCLAGTTSDLIFFFTYVKAYVHLGKHMNEDE